MPEGGGDKNLLFGDFNALVDTNRETWSNLGRYGSGKNNSNGLLLLELFCTEFNYFISSTRFKLKGDHVTM